MIASRLVLFPSSVAGRTWTVVLIRELQQLDWQLTTYLFFVGLAHGCCNGILM